MEFSERIENFQENIWPIYLPESPMDAINHVDDISSRQNYKIDQKYKWSKMRFYELFIKQ